MDNLNVAYAKAKELIATIPSGKSRQAKLDEVEQLYANKQSELKTDKFANRDRMEANKAKRDEKRAEADKAKQSRKERVRERLRNRKRDSGSTKQSDSHSTVASGEQTTVSNERTETNSPSDTTTPTRSTDETSVSNCLLYTSPSPRD